MLGPITNSMTLDGTAREKRNGCASSRGHAMKTAELVIIPRPPEAVAYHVY